MACNHSRRVTILQSYAPTRMNGWLNMSVSSVQDWALHWGYQHQFIGDELFDMVPAWYRDKVGTRFPITADLARLVWVQATLQREDVDVAVWLDADVFVFAPQHWQVDLYGRDCVFGYEYWLQPGPRGRGPKVHKNVHNAYCAFAQDSSTLPFLIDTVTRLVDNVDAKYLAPQFVGPKLLTSLHNYGGICAGGASWCDITPVGNPTC